MSNIFNKELDEFINSKEYEEFYEEFLESIKLRKFIQDTADLSEEDFLKAATNFVMSDFGEEK